MAASSARVKENDYKPPAPVAGTLRRADQAAPGGGVAPPPKVDPREYLDKAEKEWNERVDKEVGGLAGGLQTLVKAFEVEPTAASSQPHALPLSSMSLSLQHAALTKHAQNLLKITHDLKLLHLLAPPPVSTVHVGEVLAEEDDGLGALRKEVEGLQQEYDRGSD